MRFLWILLPILAQGAFGDVFKIQPPKVLVVHQGDEVELECVTNSEVTCAWKLEVPRITPTGLLTGTIPPNLGIEARDAESKTDCTITINEISEQFNGKYTCSPFSSKGGQVDSMGTDVIIAKKPASLNYLGDSADGYPLQASTDNPVTVQCKAEAARPKAEIVWYLGNTQLYDTIEVKDTYANQTRLWDTVSTLTYQFKKEDNGLSLRCRANHVGYDEADQNQREKAVDVDVQYAAYRPKDEVEIGRLYGYTAGQQGQVTINFTANPIPTSMSWKVGDLVSVPVGGQSLDGRFTSGNIMIKNASRGLYALQLTIDPVEKEDETKTFVLRVENSVGASDLEFLIGTGDAPPPSAVSGATIGGIVAAVIVLVLIVAVIAFGRSQGKWCFAAKTTEARSDRSDTESAHDEKTDKPEKKPVNKLSSLFSSLLKGNKADATDVEMAENKDETRELTKPDGQAADGEAPPPAKQAEVVYAELMLDRDGLKTEVRPSAEKTEYAVIVNPEVVDAEDNKAKE